jgi:signal transduction histidine kinase
MPPAASVEFKLCNLLEEVGFVSAPLADRKQLGFEMQSDSLASNTLVGPVADLNRVLGNLVSNAINYTTSGLVTLSAKRIDTDTLATTSADQSRTRALGSQRASKASCGSHTFAAVRRPTLFPILSLSLRWLLSKCKLYSCIISYLTRGRDGNIWHRLGAIHSKADSGGHGW